MGRISVWDRIPYNLKIKLTDSKIIDFLLNIYRKSMKPLVISYLKKDKNDIEKAEIVKFLQKNELCVFPYLFCTEYTPDKIEIGRENEMLYSIYTTHDGSRRKVYAPIGWKEDEVKAYFSGLALEQDKRSPHCYFGEMDRCNEDDLVFADFGGAEGIFSLEVIEKAKHIFIFECEEKWQIPLKKTFEPWKEKVTIVRKYIGSKDEGMTVSIDKFFENREIDCIKADIEGAEIDMFFGGKETLAKKIKYVFVAAYHRNGDEAAFCDFLRPLGYKITVNGGFMIPYLWPRRFKPPYIRRGILYARREI